jgi:hypothetical protein
MKRYCSFEDKDTLVESTKEAGSGDVSYYCSDCGNSYD